MGAKLHVQWTKKNSLIYAIRKSRIMSGTVTSTRKRSNWHKEVKLVMQEWLKRWEEFVECLNVKLCHTDMEQNCLRAGENSFSLHFLNSFPQQKTLTDPWLISRNVNSECFCFKNFPSTPTFCGLLSIISRIFSFHILPSSSPPLSVNLRWDF